MDTRRVDDRLAAAHARLGAIDAQLDALRAARADAPGDDEHDPEGSTLADDWSRLTGERTDALARLAEAQNAAARIRSGSYGVCERCGRDIGAARLDAVPTATLCIDCARGIPFARREQGES